jgi:HK97 gp10 family phage protein
LIKSTISQEWHGDEVKIMAKKVSGKSAYEIGLIVEGQATELCPVRTGRLAGSITTAAFHKRTIAQPPARWEDSIDPPSDDNEVLVGTAVEYGPYVEFGTIKTDARPFLRPALDMAKGKVLTIVQNNSRYEFKEYLKGA